MNVRRQTMRGTNRRIRASVSFHTQKGKKERKNPVGGEVSATKWIIKSNVLMEDTKKANEIRVRTLELTECLLKCPWARLLGCV